MEIRQYIDLLTERFPEVDQSMEWDSSAIPLNKLVHLRILKMSKIIIIVNSKRNGILSENKYFKHKSLFLLILIPFLFSNFQQHTLH